MKKISLLTVGYGVLICLLALGQLQRLQITPAIAIYLHELLMVVWLVAAAVSKQQTWQKVLQKLIRQFPILLFLVAWITVGLTVGLVTSSTTLVTTLYLARLGLYLLFGIELWTKRKSVEHIPEMWALVGINVAVMGLLQYFFLPDTRFLKILGWDDHYYRLISTQFDPGYAGLIMVLTVLQLQQVPWPKKVVIPLSIMLVVGILLTYSRATYLSLLVGAVFLIWRSKDRFSKVFFPLLLVLFGVGVPFLPQPASEGVLLSRTASISARVTSSTNAVAQLQPHEWIVGRGLFATTSVDSRPTPIPSHAKFPDNIILFALNGTGVIGVALFAVATIQVVMHLWKKSPVLLAGILAAACHSLFNLSLLQPFILLYLLGMNASRDALESKGHG